MAEQQTSSSALKRYSQLAVIVIAAGAIYPLLYLRQNFEVSILESFGISATQLGQCYAMLGVLFVITYLPSGWLTDRVPPRWLMSLALAMTGTLGLWFSTMPPFPALLTIFGGWGISTGLIFWSAHIKAVSLLAHHDEQGRFFGILDGGRGLFEAVLATVAVGSFAYMLNRMSMSTADALQRVIYLYSGVMLLLVPFVILALDDNRSDDAPQSDTQKPLSFWADFKTILSKVEVWLAAFCILCGYQLFWATYSFSAYMQQTYGMTAVAVGSITVAKLWMRPIGAAAAGFAGDYLNREKVLAWLLVAGAVALASLAFIPQGASVGVLIFVVLCIGILTYAVRGIYWATLDSCDIPDRIKGLAIGMMSLIGFTPDIYLPLINGKLLELYPGRPGYVIYFLGIASFGLLGAVAAWRLKTMVEAKEARAGDPP